MTSLPPTTPTVYPLLVRARNAAADDVLIDTFPDLAEGYREISLDALIERGRDEALTELVRRFQGYDRSLQALIVSRLDGVFAGVRLAISDNNFESRASAIDLIRSGGDAKLAYLLAGALSRRCAKTRTLAAEALTDLAKQYLERRASVRAGRYDPTLGRWGRTLASAIQQALASWSAHFRTEVLVVAMWLADHLEDLIVARVNEPRSKLAHAFNETLRASPDPGKAGYVLRMLRVPALRAKAARMIAVCRDTATMTAILDESWVLADPELRRATARVRNLSWLDDGIEPVLSLSPRRMAAAARLVGASGIGVDKKVAFLREMADSVYAQLKEAAVWELVSMRSDAATRALHCIAKHHGDCVSRIAARELRRRSAASGAPETIASANTPERGEAAFDRFWLEFDRLSPHERTLRGEQVRRSVPDFDRKLRAKLRGNDPSDRVRGVLVVRELGLAAEMDTQLYALAHDPDPLVRSTTIGTLPQVDGPTTRRVLHGALHDTDERVQANAIEALDSLEAAQFTDSIRGKLDSPSNRVRANAVLSLLKLEVHEAADVLLAMIDSELRADRLSALWIVECLELKSVTDRLVELAKNDLDAQVRHRAQRIAEAIGVLPRDAAEPAPVETVSE